jgi:hypothetical protein
LKSGEWHPVPTSDALTYFGIHYSREVVWPNLVGVQKLFNGFLDMPLCLTSFFVFGFLSPSCATAVQECTQSAVAADA